ncbi:amidohydrolase family protein [Microbacterium kyungheense]|uniref:Amidohydrolase family protein n=1 Tax=Microbacterium kyungheense TaxID=1263636 RepID=A0A543F0G2_9MICO|nr:amidohydrolase family protein [Microbacterium kyungheense]TQM19650.1 amidohydrolase family protein [Microbacterium kyungheense]TQM27322.1 amidohydrolase family protein [Microbacterium kyungheense]
MTVIDAHTHLDAGRFDPRVFELGDRLGVEQFLCTDIGAFVAHPAIDEVREMNRTLAGELRRHPERLRGYCYVNPRYGRATMDDLRRNVEEEGMIGIKLWIATLADDPLCDPILEYAAQHRLIVLAHAWRKTVGGFPYESTADHIARAAARHPDVRFLMAHLGGQPESAVDMVQPHPNVMVDTSGTIIGAGEVALAVDRLGADRVVFGSDLHHVDLVETVGKVLGAGLDAEDERLVFGENIERWLAEVAR